MSKDPLRDSMGRFIDPPEPPISVRKHRGIDWDSSHVPLMIKLRALADRNARLEKTQECWEKCNCKKK